MNPSEYVFHIDAFTPDTLPMARLAQYVAELARLVGHQEHTHFRGVEKGSAQLRYAVDPVDAPKVETRLNGIRIGAGAKDATAAQRALEDMLANDNAVATLFVADTEEVVLPFVGRNRPKPIVFPPFREDTSLDGVIVNIGGKDLTAHATLQNGEVFHTNISMKRDLARQLAPLLYGEPIRLHGNGRFERQAGGSWRMIEFRVDRWEKLDPRPLATILKGLADVAGTGLLDPEAYHDVLGDR